MARHRFVAGAFVVLSVIGSALSPVRAGTTRSATAPQVLRAEQLVGVSLPDAGALAPAPDARVFASPLPRHVVLGFIGADGLSGVTPIELADVSELVTNTTALTVSGALSSTTPGWTDLSEASFPEFVTTAHHQGDRVLLGIANGSNAALARMLRQPANAATRLASSVLPILRADHLDGVDLDIEGGAASQRSAFTTFVIVLERALTRGDPGLQVVVNVAPSSASVAGFFNVQALGAVASALFVMDYDMVPGGAAGPNAPLVSSAPQVSDLSSLLAYTRVVPASKLILGIPFYGYDFPTKSDAPGSRTTGPAESVTYEDIVTVGHVGHWDATALTPYYVFLRAKTWHETYYDDPVSVALKAALASVFGLLGVGLWSLGQEGTSSSMLRALDGGTSPRHLPVASS